MLYEHNTHFYFILISPSCNVFGSCRSCCLCTCLCYVSAYHCITRSCSGVFKLLSALGRSLWWVLPKKKKASSAWFMSWPSCFGEYWFNDPYITLCKAIRLSMHWWWWWYHSLMPHQHEKGHTVPKQVIMIATSIQVTTVLSTARCESNSLSGQVWTKCWYCEVYDISFRGLGRAHQCSRVHCRLGFLLVRETCQW